MYDAPILHPCNLAFCITRRHVIERDVIMIDYAGDLRDRRQVLPEHRLSRSVDVERSNVRHVFRSEQFRDFANGNGFTWRPISSSHLG
jgi:hypothetical protein